MTEPGTEEFWEHVLATLLELDSSSYYELLGVTQDTHIDVVRSHYERLNLRLHPDAHTGEPDEERRRAIKLVHERLHEAYVVLANPTSRARYDARLARGVLRIDGAVPPEAPPETTPAQPHTPSRVEVARALFNQGKRMASDGDLRGAKVKWEMALHVLPRSKAIRAALGKLKQTMVARTDARHPMSRPVKVSCRSWEQFRTLYTRDISRGGMFLRTDKPLEIGTSVTLSLELPDAQLLELEAEVAHIAGPGATTGEGMGIRFLNMSPSIKAKVEQYMASGREPSRVDVPIAAPSRMTESVVADVEKPSADLVIREQLLDVLVEMRAASDHDVLGVPPDAEPSVVRGAYLQLAKRFHPDLYGRYRDNDITDAANEASFLVRQAYNKMRATDQAEPERAPDVELQVAAVPAPIDREDEESLPVRSLLGEDLFDDDTVEPPPSVANEMPELSDVTAARRGREALEAGRYAEAIEQLARALDAAPRDRILRAAFHLASAFDAKANDRSDAAREHFETVLLFDKQCAEAINELRTGAPTDEPARSIFDRLFKRTPTQ